MSLSFSRESRLRTSADFKQVFDTTDIKVSSRQLLILAKVNKLGRARLGLVVAKKTIRTAVGRNRAKRHIRETFRLQRDGMGGLDVVVLVRKGFSDLNDRDLNLLLNQQLQRLKRRLHERKALAEARPDKHPT